MAKNQQVNQTDNEIPPSIANLIDPWIIYHLKQTVSSGIHYKNQLYGVINSFILSIFPLRRLHGFPRLLSKGLWMQMKLTKILETSPSGPPEGCMNPEISVRCIHFWNQAIPHMHSVCTPSGHRSWENYTGFCRMQDHATGWIYSPPLHCLRHRDKAKSYGRGEGQAENYWISNTYCAASFSRWEPMCLSDGWPSSSIPTGSWRR
jgi:hypothetical protein